MTSTPKSRRIGRMGWIAIVGVGAVVLAVLAIAACYFTNPVALLDGGDRLLGGSGGAQLVRHAQPFGPHPAQVLEVDAPASTGTPAAPRPVLVFIHGGSWNSGTPGNYNFVGRTFARAGYVVVLAGYRLGPDGKFPAMVDDGAAAVRWVHDHAAELGGDPARIFLAGHSAGAYNVMMLGLERQWLGREGLDPGMIRGVIGLSGPYDFYPFTSDSARAAFGHVADPAQTQPISFARGDAPPLLLVTGDMDTTVKPRNSFALAKAISAAGTPTTVTVIAGADHNKVVMMLAHPFSNDARVLNAMLAFMAAHGGAPFPASAPVQPAGG